MVVVLSSSTKCQHNSIAALDLEEVRGRPFGNRHPLNKLKNARLDMRVAQWHRNNCFCRAGELNGKTFVQLSRYWTDFSLHRLEM
jgi:hypothetical protein